MRKLANGEIGQTHEILIYTQTEKFSV